MAEGFALAHIYESYLNVVHITLSDEVQSPSNAKIANVVCAYDSS